MDHGVRNLTEESQRRLLAAIGLHRTDVSSDERTIVLKEYRVGLNAASRSLNLNDISRAHFEDLIRNSITVCSGGWPSIKKAEVRSRLQIDGTISLAVVNRAIDLGLRMWLMIDCCVDASTLFPKTWSEDEGIEDFVRNRFDMIDKDDDAEPIARFPRRFRAVELERLCGITVQWTSFLDEHLRFTEDNRELKVFNKKALLVALLNKAEIQSDHAAIAPAQPLHESEVHHGDGTRAELRREVGIPKKLLAETLQTLDVLFPPWHEPTIQFLQSRDQNLHSIPPFPRDVPKLREFQFWRYRLIDLIAEYESPPLNWKHIWRDRRNPAAFWTFWIGMAIFVFTMVFGIVASVLAGIQVKLAKATMEMTASLGAS